MKILRTRAASVSRQGLCTALLVASLTTAAVGASPPHGTGADDPTPGPDNPQRQPHGVPNLSLPDLVPRPGATPKPGEPGSGTGGGSSDIPATALAAYKNAEGLAKGLYPNCHIKWELIAGIGKVESEHAASYGLQPDGSTTKPIRGPQLTGDKFALVKDTDGGAWDGDPVYDRAVGPTQFIPSTWKDYGADGNGDGKLDPNNIFDAAAGTARYLCAGGKDLSDGAQLDKAILSYNNSREYVNAVLAWMHTYENGGSGSTPGGSTPWIPTPTRPSGTTPVPGPVRPSTPSTPAKPSQPSRPNKPSEPNKPTNPPTPNKPDNPSKPDNPGGGGDKPTPSKPVEFKAIEHVGTAELTATVDDEAFADHAKVKVVTADGRPVPKGTQVRFEVIGPKTKARFTVDGKDSTFALATVAEDGTATAPDLKAGSVAGDFALRATVDGKDGAKAGKFDFAATVKPRLATALQRIGKDELKATPKGSFAGRITVEASGDGKVVAGAKVTASILGPDGKPATTGPYFKDENGKPARKPLTFTTDDNGRIVLPELFTDEQSGTYTLELTTTNGAVLKLTLTVAAPAPEPTKPAPSPSPSATAKK
ncbi:lytic murein transglycosylase [Streptomyces sp. NPDC049585]|uniref:lytic transglycosylase domain-containing protein n=1 Tax=Streptomyces sp. NPDC049585 TaxID=3155154 RepID=UPI003415CE94